MNDMFTMICGWCIRTRFCGTRCLVAVAALEYSEPCSKYYSSILDSFVVSSIEESKNATCIVSMNRSGVAINCNFMFGWRTGTRGGKKCVRNWSASAAASGQKAQVSEWQNWTWESCCRALEGEESSSGGHEPAFVELPLGQPKSSKPNVHSTWTKFCKDL